MKRINNPKELYQKALFKTFFHNPEWQDFLEKKFKWLKFEHYADSNWFLSFGRIGEKLISLPFCEYGGPLPLKKEYDFERFKKDAEKEFKNFKIKVHPKIHKEIGDPNISTYWLDLKDKSEKELLSSFRKTLRHSIQNSQKSDLRVEKCVNTRDLKVFYNLYVANLKRKKTVPYPFSVIEFLYKRPETEILLALYKDKIIAGDLFLHYSNFIHYFISASDYKYKKLGASYLILWGKIRNLAGKDLIFDFGAAPKGSQLETFKKGWRGEEYPIMQIGIERDEESLRSSKLVRVIWGLLPVFVIKIISRYFIRYRI